jgi:exopolysaccharide biosynthesis polyprenyl glycosylphosphotransferase
MLLRAHDAANGIEKQVSDQRTIPGHRSGGFPDEGGPFAHGPRNPNTRASLIDHEARAALRNTDIPRECWETRLVRQLVIVDLVSFLLAEAGSWALRGSDVTDNLTLFGLHVPYFAVGIAGFPAWLIMLSAMNAYDRSLIGSSPTEYSSVARATFGLFTLVCASAFLGGVAMSRGLFAVFFPLLLVVSLLARHLVRKQLHRRRTAGRDQRRVVLVSRTSAIANVTDHFRRTPHVGYEVVGAYLPGLHGRETAPPNVDVALLGEPDDLIRDLDDLDIDAVALSGGELFETESLRSLAWKLHDTGVQLLMAPDLAEIAGPRIVSRPAGGLPLLLVDEPHTSGFAQLVKSTVERAAALFACVVLAPVFAVIALAIKCTSQGPVLFRQTRVARDGREFSMLKFRSMVDGAEHLVHDLVDQNDHDGVLFKIKDDPRVTKIGGFLRKYSLDELPQLWNVVRGEMAMIGPRPPLPSEVEKYGDTTRRRLMVKPGITGLWQVSGRSDLSWEESVRLDLYYVENWSPLLDAFILAKTLKAVLAGKGAY